MSTLIAPGVARVPFAFRARAEQITAGWAEAQRLAALDKYQILDTPPERIFDELVELVADLLGVPIAAVNLVAADRQWSKSQIGLGTQEMSLETAFCPQALRLTDTLVVPDATRDPRFADSPLVTGPGNLRFYAGEVLHSREGQPLGTFCVADTEPRVGLDLRERDILKTLARQVVSHLELRRTILERDEALAEQQRAAEAHRSDASFLRGLLDASEDCIAVLDLDGKLVFMNAFGLRSLGAYGAADISGLSWLDAWEGDAIEAAAAAVTAARTGTAGRFRGRSTTATANPKWWDVQLTPIRDAAGRPERMLSVARDITAACAADDALRESQWLNTAILNSSTDVIVVFDLEGRYRHMSPGALAAMEVPDFDALRGTDGFRSWQGDDLAAARAAFAEARAGGTGRFQGLATAQDRTPKHWDYVVAPMPGLDGRPEGLVAIGRDITALKQAEKRLALSEERLNLALGASTIIGLWDWDLKTDTVYADANFARMYGIDPARAAAGVSIEACAHRYPPEERTAFEAVRTRLAAGIDDHAREFRLVLPDGSVRWLLSRGRPVRDSDGTPVRLPGAVVDITERRQAEAALREANDRLEERVAAALTQREEIEEALRQSQKMEAVGQLTGGIAHDFNNLLASISGALEIMQERLEQRRFDNLGRYIDAAQGAARRATALTHRLLAFSRRQTLDPRPTDINHLVLGMEELIRRTAGPGITVAVATDPKLSNALIDPNQLENALLNLCINARDAMPEGGRLSIRTATGWHAQPDPDSDLPAGPCTQVSVTDTGAGMSPDIVKRAFDPFFTTKPIGMGTGLGLSMVYGFVRQSGGMVTIDSTRGEGTTVNLYLPCDFCTIDATESGAAPNPAAPVASGETILVVDDEPTLRALVTEILQERGYHTREAGDGAGGLEVLRSDARVDLLLTDVGLPGGMNGRQLADAARALRPGLRVLFITGYAENAALGEGNLERGMEVLTKPFPMGTLATRIRNLIEQKDR